MWKYAKQKTMFSNSVALPILISLVIWTHSLLQYVFRKAGSVCPGNFEGCTLFDYM